jgi:hypothetical protein
MSKPERRVALTIYGPIAQNLTKHNGDMMVK